MSFREACSQVAGHRQMDKFVPETLAPSLSGLLRRIHAQENSSV